MLKEPYYKIVLDSVADGVFTVDQSWRITSWNRAAEVITGYSAKEAIGRHCYEVFQTDICRDACALKRTMATGEEQINVHIKARTKDGSKKTISVSTALLRDADGGPPVGGAETFRDLSQIESLRKRLNSAHSFQDIVGKNHKMQKMFSTLPTIARSECTVLVQGPSGSGKELVAQALHNLSPRANGPFVVVNCVALPDTLLESELFGYKKGAFTDARQDKPGRFALAHKGTLFLDEIGEMPIALQGKLLRVLQEGVYDPLGSTKPVRTDARILTATNKNLKDQIACGRFRDDLFYRINVVTIDLPPLRERREDIPLLVDHFLGRLNSAKGAGIEGLSDEALAILMEYDYPGNVRELQNVVERAYILSDSAVITSDALSKDLRKGHGSSTAPTREEAPLSFQQAQAEVIQHTLRKHGGHREKSAQALGIHKTTLIRKMKKLGIR
jgi:PAS domain S-box-containing protein